MRKVVPFTSGREETQAGIAHDMRGPLLELSEMIPLLPDARIIEARRLLHGLFDCADRVAALEDAAGVLSPAEDSRHA